jgi:hypothetical protein
VSISGISAGIVNAQQIAAAELGESNLWLHHLSWLLRIVFMRRKILTYEPYPFFIWWICQIDIYAAFSGIGDGTFVNTMLKHDMLPPPNLHLYPLGTEGSSVIRPEEENTLPALLKLDHELSVLAAKLGQLAREFRRKAMAQANDSCFSLEDLNLRNRRSRTSELQAAFRLFWDTLNIPPLSLSIDTLPKRSMEMFVHVSISLCPLSLCLRLVDYVKAVLVQDLAVFEELILLLNYI